MIEPVARIRIELQDLEPRIWRRVDVPLSSTLAALNDIIQVSFHWQDYHLYEFVVGERVYGVPEDEDEFYDRKTYKAAAIRLKTLVERGVDRFLYVYDFGDNWRHDVVVEGLRDGDEDTEYPAFVDGARRCPPEDVGGTDGFMEFLEAVLDASHEEHDRMREWYGGPFDPEDIDEQRIRLVLGSPPDPGPSASRGLRATGRWRQADAAPRWQARPCLPRRPARVGAAAWPRSCPC